MKTPSPKSEDIELPGGLTFLVVQGEPYLLYNRVTKKHEIAVEETIFKYENDGEVLKDCYNNTVILDYDADEKTVFHYKLKGRTVPDFPEEPS